MTFGFHRRRSVLNVRSGGVHNPVSLYDEHYINHRSRVIAYGINARRKRFPQETPYHYVPLANKMAEFEWNDDAKASMHDYNLQDIGI